MKTLTIVFSILSLLTFNGYSQNVDVKGLLDKPETRTEIFNTILENHELMMEFMKNMKGNEHAMMMMEGDSKMMGHDGKMEIKEDHQMMDHAKMMGNMMEICKGDSAICSKMMMQIMKEKGMMDKDCCMQMMHKKDDDKQEHKHQH